MLAIVNDELLSKFTDGNDTTVWDGVQTIYDTLTGWLFSQYGTCGGANDGCLYAQEQFAKLIGELEANALLGAHPRL